jgi:hypothetical protein
MTKISELHRRWSKDRDYKDAYDALGEEFDLARALIEARTAAGLSQAELAPAHEDLAVLHRWHRRRKGGSLDGRIRAFRAGDSYASEDRVRTACRAVNPHPVGCK